MIKKKALIIASLIYSTSVFQSEASILYKNYVVGHYMGSDILCEPYTVQKNDSVIKLLKQKGEISNEDFPRFLSMFTHLNPEVVDINLIRENDEIYIPLKTLAPGSMPGQETGVISIPFVSLSSFGEMIGPHTEKYTIREGDNITSITDTFFAPCNPAEKRQAFELVKLMNPQLSSMEHIAAGQKISVPKKSIKTEPWYHKIYDSKGRIRPEKAAAYQAESGFADSSGNSVDSKKSFKADASAAVSDRSSEPDAASGPERAMEKFASLIGGTIYRRGQFYIPKGDGTVHKIDLSTEPLMEMEGGGRVLFCRNLDAMNEADITSIKRRMAGVVLVDTKKADSFDSLVEAMVSASVLSKSVFPVVLNFKNAVIEVTPEWFFSPSAKSGNKKIFITETDDRSPDSHAFFIDLMKHTKGILLQETGKTRKEKEKKGADYFIDESITVSFSGQTALLSGLANALGYRFAEKAVHSVASGNSSVEITADTIYAADGKIYVIGNDNFSAGDSGVFEKSGIKVIRPYHNPDEVDYSEGTVMAFLEMIGCNPEKNPDLRLVSRKSGEPYISLKPSGIHAKTSENSEFLITKGLFESPVIAALQHAGIKIIHLEYNSFFDSES